MKARINGVELAYGDRGTGTPVVFIHGFPLNRRMWEPQVEALSDRFRIITVDLRGHGESEAPLWHYSIDQFADDVNGLLDHLSVQQAVMVGLSMGGYVLFTFYRKYTGKVRAMVLTDTRAQADTEEVRAGRFNMAQAAYAKGTGPILEAMLPKLLSPTSRETRADLVERVTSMVTSMQLSGIVGDLIAMAERADAVPVLKEITCPTLVLVGELDPATPPEEVRGIAEGIRGARFEVIPGAAHLPNLEQPEAFNRALVSFLDALG